MPAPIATRVLPVLAALLITLPAIAQDRGPGGQRDPAQMMRLLPVMRALDTDEDSALSSEEIDGAAAALLTLDADGDGNLTRDEIAPPREAGFPRMPGMMRLVPLMRALDLDGDEELFEDEVTDAASHLRTLDLDGDGLLSAEELAPQMPNFGRRGRGGPGRRGGGDDGDGEPIVTPRPEELQEIDGTATIPDRETFKRLSYQGPDVMVDTHLAGIEYVKFQLEAAGSDDARMYFMNTKTHRSHPGFMAQFGMPNDREGGQMRGVIVYRPTLMAPNGEPGLYTYEFEPNDAYGFEMVKICHDLLAAKSDLMRGRLAYNLLPRAREQYLTEPEKYEAAGLAVYDETDLDIAVAFLPLHPAESFGRLRLMTLEERPGPRDIVIYQTLPNEMPRVAGIITAVRQTPLSHVNLRAIQDDVPNAFIAGAAGDRAIVGLVGSYVHYRVSADGYELRQASAAEVESHFADLRPAEAQIPPRNLTETAIRPLERIEFSDADSVGVKAANIAAMRCFLPEGSVPGGYAVPFAFYDEFMTYNDFYTMARTMMGTRDFAASAETRAASLEQFQSTLKKGKMPPWMMEALAEVQRAFPAGTPIRCRSSTNNEDLPGFSGAGLYDSFTHHPDEGHLSKSIRQVFASLWNFRAYEEREFYRIDHFAAAMGVLLHENTDAEQANGVAVTDDIMNQGVGQIGPRYYINVQVGEDLVTNPGSQSVPEEILLSPRNPNTDKVVQRSNRAPAGVDSLLSAEHRTELRRCLRAIHSEFASLYEVGPDEPFAMEVEFKITAEGELSIKQARPWVH